MSEQPNHKALRAHDNKKQQITPNHDPQRPSERMGTDTRSGGRDVSRGGDATGRAVSNVAAGGGTQAVEQASASPGTTGPLAQMHKLIERSGEEPFPNEIICILSEPIDDRLVDIRPDGLIYVSHPHYRDRLDRAFGPGAWALVPLAQPKVSGNRVIYYGFLKARGQYISDAFGGASYYPQNRDGNFDNSAEAAKSDCLVRCCKALPMFRECWDKEYADYWCATYAEQGVTRQSQGKVVWKKKGEAMRDFTLRPDRQSESEFRKRESLLDENQRHIDSIPGNRPLLTRANEAFNENSDSYLTDSELAQEAAQADAIPIDDADTYGGKF